MLEPASIVDARARVTTLPATLPVAQPRKGHVRKPQYGVPLAALLSDLLALAFVAVFVRADPQDAAIFAVMVIGARIAARHYRPRIVLDALDDLPRSVGATLCGVGLTLVVSYVLAGGKLVGHDLLYRAALFVLAATVLQSVTFAVVRRSRRRRPMGRRTLIVGAGRVGTLLAEALLEHPELGLTPVGFAEPEPATFELERAMSGVPILMSDMSELARAIVDNQIDTAVLAFSGTTEEHVDTVITAHQTGCNILLVPSLFELHHDSPGVERVRGIPVLRLRPDPTLRPSWWIKRSIDVLVGAIGLLLLSVPLGLVALISLIDSGRPILFWQERIGVDGRPFRLCKFRSMRPESETESQTQWNIGSDPRVSRFGRLLRRTSVDELPQLWNIVRGQMSLVGPRPERPTFVEKFSQEHDRYWARHRVPVGLTGLAQVNGLRGDTSIRERALYDNYYIANWSLWLDAKVLLLTVREVLGARGR